MADSVAASTKIVDIVGQGLTLATTLQTYVESQRYPTARLRELTYEINSTTGALRQLQQIIQADKRLGDTTSLSSKPRVLKDEGRQEIESRAAQCEILFNTIVTVVTKASTAGLKGKAKMATIDTSALKATNLVRNMRWSWLEPRIKRCREQLGYLNLNLLLILQIASVARHQIG